MEDSVPGSVMSVGRPDGARLLVRGRLDAEAAGRLRGLLEDVQAPRAAVSVDLSRAGTLPWRVLQALAATHRRLGVGALVLAQPSPAALRSLRVSGLHQVLRVEGSAAERTSSGPVVGLAADL